MHALTRAAATAALLGHAALAAVMLPQIFSDGVVLQSRDEYGQRPIFYGYAAPGEVVTINVTIGKSVSTFSGVASADTGRWSVELAVNDQVTNVSIAVWGDSDPSDVITIKDAAYGEVLLCGGQSNIVMDVVTTFDGPAIANQTWPTIRLFNVIETGADTPQNDLPPVAKFKPSQCVWYDNPAGGNKDVHVCQQWQVATPGVTEYMSAICFYTAMNLITSGAIPADRVVGLVHSALPGTAMELWVQQPVIDACAAHAGSGGGQGGTASVAQLHTPPGGTASYNNSALFNAMINPLVGFAFRGLLWDQGESNSGQPYAYFSCLFQGLIESWRRLWRIGDFAFVYVSLGAQEFSPSQWPSYLATTRDAQASALPGQGTTDTTGVVMTYDLGDRTSPYAPAHVHTRNKTEVGRRMALILQHVQWGRQWPAGGYPLPVGAAPLDWSGPTPTQLVDAGDGSYTLSFSTLTGAGVYLAPTKDCWECCAAGDTFQFVVAGAHGAAAVVYVNTTVTLLPAGGATAAAAPPTRVKLTPSTPGTYTTVRYAPSLWPQCAVYSVSNDVPANTFSALNVTAPAPAAGHGAVVDTMATAEAARGAVADGEVRARAAASPWLATGWRGRRIPLPAPGAVALLPPLGWNSWNSYHSNVDHNLVLRVADAMVSTGLQKAGFTYVNIDDTWQVDRDLNGTVIPDPVRFPYGMRALADAVHAKGFKFGLYTAQGSRTCQARPGAYGHESLDAATYCSWGLDFLKIDLCGGTLHPALNTSWSLFHDGFAQCTAGGGRPIVESIEYCSDPSPTGCGPTIGQVANMWRTTPDVQATFASILSNLDGNNVMAEWTRPGNWADPDLLQLGNPGVSLEEAKTQFTAWCVVAAPLLVSTDLASGVDDAVLAILTAPEVLAVNQDALGVQGIRVSPANASGVECWAKPLADGSVAAMLLNRGPDTTTAACTWAEIGLKQPGASADVRDLWARANLGPFAGGYSCSVPSHGAVLVKVTQ